MQLLGKNGAAFSIGMNEEGMIQEHQSEQDEMDHSLLADAMSVVSEPCHPSPHKLQSTSKFGKIKRTFNEPNIDVQRRSFGVGS